MDTRANDRSEPARLSAGDSCPQCGLTIAYFVSRGTQGMQPGIGRHPLTEIGMPCGHIEQSQR